MQRHLGCASRRNTAMPKRHGNIYGMFAGAVVKKSTIVGHYPRDISAPCFIFIWRGGSITCLVTGGRRYTSIHLKVPCVLKF